MNPNGTGLGLKMSNDLAQLLGPKGNKGIQIISNVGIGSEFFFFILYEPDLKNKDDNIIIPDESSSNNNGL